MHRRIVVMMMTARQYREARRNACSTSAALALPDCSVICDGIGILCTIPVESEE